MVSSSGITGWHDEAKVGPPGVVTGRYGTLGEVHFLDKPFWPLNTALYVTDFHGNDPRFVSYFLKCQDLGAYDGAAAVPGINRNVIHQLPTRRPPLPIQRKIASILSAYDDLIGNNTRRIKILEEMAQRIYREWFVDYRYPGHEGVPLVESELGPIPHGWNAGRVGDAMTFVYGKALKAEGRRGGPVAVFGSSGVVGYHDEALDPGPGIVVGRKGNVGAIHWSDGPFYPIDTTYWVRTELPLIFCLHSLRDLVFVNSHAAVPGLNREHAYALPLVTPDPEVSTRFERISAELFMLRRVLIDSNRGLMEARDLLLPRLVSGEIDVSDLDIQVPEAA